ncbi:MAG: hypothetical protein OXN94_00775, partial [Chloroflexota bacterium]|nr:hypothetical protein [Chloroflexota bacterium]
VEKSRQHDPVADKPCRGDILCRPQTEMIFCISLCPLCSLWLIFGLDSQHFSRYHFDAIALKTVAAFQIIGKSSDSLPGRKHDQTQVA